MEFGIKIAIDLAPGGFSHGDRGNGSVQRGGAGQRPGAYPGAGSGPAVYGGPVRASDRAMAPGQPGGVGRGSSPARPSDRLSRREEGAVRGGGGPIGEGAGGGKGETSGG